MSALAIYAKERGFGVTGSDTEETFVTDKTLQKAGISVLPFSPQNLKSRPEIVVVSAAYSKDNIEVREARRRHLEIKPYSEALAMFANDLQIIAVAGIHGKTTTTALLSFILTKANLDPSFVIGSGEIPSLGATGHFGRGDYFVLEADEYRKSSEEMTSKFLDFSPKVEIITSIEMDHPDMFSTEEKVYDAFYKFACRVPRTGFIVLCVDYPKTRKIIHSLVDRNFETYGFNEKASWQIVDFLEIQDYSSFYILNCGNKIGPFKIKLPGKFNALNATAAIITALRLGIEEKLAKKYLFSFSGVKRRFEKIGQVDNITIIDDYAHHPRSVAMALEAARARYPQAEIYCIFQAHTYSRTKELLNEFASSFRAADHVIITEIYASQRETKATISGQDLASAIRKEQKSVKFIPDKNKIVQELVDNVTRPALIITMGAGDIYKLGNLILERLQKDSK